jgi:hypothetical protein
MTRKKRPHHHHHTNTNNKRTTTNRKQRRNSHNQEQQQVPCTALHNNRPGADTKASLAKARRAAETKQNQRQQLMMLADHLTPDVHLGQILFRDLPDVHKSLVEIENEKHTLKQKEDAKHDTMQRVVNHDESSHKNMVLTTIDADTSRSKSNIPHQYILYAIYQVQSNLQSTINFSFAIHAIHHDHYHQ